MPKNTSIWISDLIRPGKALLGALLLSGCMDGGGDIVNRFSSATDKVSVAGNAVTVAGPRGYCVDRSVTRARVQPAFVMLASCAAISRKTDAPSPNVPALLTATVAAPSAPAPVSDDQAARLRAFFSSSAGHAALARDGQPDSVEILDMFPQSGAFFIHASDRSGGDASNLRHDYWRAIFNVNGRTVSATVFAFRNRPISDDAGLNMLSEFTHRIRAASRDGA